MLTGGSKGNVYCNDSDQGITKEATVKGFNAKRASKLQGCLMVKDPRRCSVVERSSIDAPGMIIPPLNGTANMGKYGAPASPLS